MAAKRMFSLDVVDTDKFLEMPTSTQCLYFHLGIRADDEGFVSAPKKILKLTGCSNDDLRILIAKEYIIPFDEGVVVIVDWNVNNWIRPDRKHNTRFQEEKRQLALVNGRYILTDSCQLIDGQMSVNCPTEISIDKISIDKNSIDKNKEDREYINYQQIADMYNDTCVSFPRLTKLSESRKKAIKARLKVYTLEDFEKLFQMAENSSFLKGGNSRNWSANFDWLIKDSNMAKVLDGNYQDNIDTRQQAQQDIRPEDYNYSYEYKELYENLSQNNACVDNVF